MESSYSNKSKIQLINEIKKLEKQLAEFKKADYELKTTLKAYHDLFETAPIGYHEINTKGIIQRVNQTEADLLGYTKDEMINRSITDFVVEKEKAKKAIKEKVLGKKMVKGFERQYRRKDGTIIDVYIEDRLVHNEKGQVIGIRSTLLDISERKLAERDLKIERNLLRTIIDTIPDSIYAKDTKSRFIIANKEVARRVGALSPEELIGKTDFDVYPRELAEKYRKNEKNILQTGKPRINREEIIRDSKGNEIWNLTNKVIFKDPVGKIIGLIGIGRNITKIRNAQEKLKISEKKYRTLSSELIKANTMKELLLDIITHDLRNPVGVIAGMIDIMAIEFPDREEIQLIKQGSNEIVKVIENATTLSHVALGEAISKENLEIIEILKNTFKEFEIPLKESGVNLDYHLPESLIIEANPIIVEIFKNFISNAIKYASEGKQIVVDLTDENKSYIFSIKDFGVTIPKRDYKQIFERGMRLKMKKTHGRGLGLTIVKRIAEAHGCKVWVEPNKPTGNIFFLSIPK